MADIHLTNGDDIYVQPLSDKDNYNNVYGDDGNDAISMYSGTAIGGKGNDRFEFLPIALEPWRELGVAYWNSPGVEVNLAEGWANDGLGGHDTLIGIRRVHGSGFDAESILRRRYADDLDGLSAQIQSDGCAVFLHETV